MTLKRMSKETVHHVLQRDGSTCIMCGSTENIQLAHIKSRGSRPDLIDDPENIVCLCFQCHTIRQHSQGTLTREMLEARMEERGGD